MPYDTLEEAHEAFAAECRTMDSRPRRVWLTKYVEGEEVLDYAEILPRRV